MKTFIFTFVASMLIAQNLAHAETDGFFPSNEKGIILIQNGKSPDANFFWDIFLIKSSFSGATETKSFNSAHGDFKVSCNRDHTTAPPNTVCTVTVTKVDGGGLVTITKEENKMGGIFSGELIPFFHLQQRLLTKSPDGLMSFCPACSRAAPMFSLTWQE